MINEGKEYIFVQDFSDSINEGVKKFIDFFDRNASVNIDELEKALLYIEEVLNSW